MTNVIGKSGRFEMLKRCMYADEKFRDTRPACEGVGSETFGDLCSNCAKVQTVYGIVGDMAYYLHGEPQHTKHVGYIVSALTRLGEEQTRKLGMGKKWDEYMTP